MILINKESQFANTLGLSAFWMTEPLQDYIDLTHFKWESAVTYSFILICESAFQPKLNIKQSDTPLKTKWTTAGRLLS